MNRCKGLICGRWVKLGSCFLVIGALVVGCTGAEEGGTPEFSQKFEQPSVAPPVPKEKPTPYKDLSPRERKALKKSEG